MEHVDYLQIGAHVGNTTNDGLFDINEVNKNYILIEPVPHLFEQLRSNYKQKTTNNNIVFLNIAISNKDDVLSLYVPSKSNDFTKFPWFASQISSTNADHIQTHQGVQDLIVDKVTVPCLKLNTLINNMKIKTIDWLMVDTEGHDYDILMSFDLTHIRPSRITFENAHMDGVFSKGEKYVKLLNYLYSHGYVKRYENNEDTTVILL